MVYAVAMRTLEQFDRALGRTRLLHAAAGACASSRTRSAAATPSITRQLRAVLFGYFRASQDAPGENLPGQLIFTCLSHDIIAHEVTHALVDRLRPYFNDGDQPARPRLPRRLRRHRGGVPAPELPRPGPARAPETRAATCARASCCRTSPRSSGRASAAARRCAPRSTDDTTKIQDVHEEHALGAVLVAAIFDGFFTPVSERGRRTCSASRRAAPASCPRARCTPTSSRA